MKRIAILFTAGILLVMTGSLAPTFADTDTEPLQTEEENQSVEEPQPNFEDMLMNDYNAEVESEKGEEYEGLSHDSINNEEAVSDDGGYEDNPDEVLVDGDEV